MSAALVCCTSQSADETSEDDGVITGVGGAVAASSSVATSASAGGSATSAGGATSAGTGGAGGEPSCPDAGLGEPNESEDTAYKLKAESIDDCDGSGDGVSGVIAGQGDVDWFYYVGDDSVLCSVDPTRVLTQASGSGLRLCKFLRCTDSSATIEFDCPMGTSAATSPNGRPGCCGTSGFDIEPVNCTGTSDEVIEVYMRLDAPNATAETCDGYTLDYHY